MISKSKLYMVGYGAFTLTSFAGSLAYSGSRSYDFLTLMQELTDGVRFTVLLNFIVFCFLFGGLISTKIFFGNVRLIEIEHIADTLPFYGLNLLFILFNDNNLILSVTWTGLTLFSKIHHIITFDRVEMLQVKAVNMLTSHTCTRLSIIKLFIMNLYLWMLVALFVCDVVLARILAYDIFQGVSSMGSLLFGIQFGVLGIETFTFLSKLLLNVYELAFYRCTASAEVAATEDLDEDSDDDDLEQHIWKNRPLYTQGLDITSSALESTFYSVFLYTLYFHSEISPPINIIQGFIISMHQIIKKGNSIYRFLNQSRHLENQLTDPTEEELETFDHLCIVCREDMHLPQKFLQTRGKALNSRKHPKKMRCGHILHLCCLKEWIEISDCCPLCRTVVVEPESAPASTQAAPAQPVPIAPPANPIQTFAPALARLPRAETATQNPPLFTAEDLFQPAADVHTAHPVHTPGTDSVAEASEDHADWLTIPITPGTEPSSYNFSLSSTEQGTLRIKHRSTRNYPGRFFQD